MPPDPCGNASENASARFANRLRARTGGVRHGIDDRMHLRAPDGALLSRMVCRARLRFDDLPHVPDPSFRAEKDAVRQLVPERILAVDLRADRLPIVRMSLIALRVKERKGRGEIEPIGGSVEPGRGAIAR